MRVPCLDAKGDAGLECLEFPSFISSQAFLFAANPAGEDAVFPSLSFAYNCPRAASEYT